MMKFYPWLDLGDVVVERALEALRFDASLVGRGRYLCLQILQIIIIILQFLKGT